MGSDHNDRILEQFTRQAVPFSQAPAVRNAANLDRLVQIAEAGPQDVALDVACGPGLLVCAFARVVRHATGIDLTAAMLEQACKLQQQEGLDNITWQRGDVLPLPFADGQFSIVTARLAFHHFLDPLAVLKEMRRVCRPGGRVLVADTAPSANKAEAFNMMERLRDPSHVRALPVEEHRALFERAGLPEPRMTTYRMEDEVEVFLRRSFPKTEADGDRVRQMITDCLENDFLDVMPFRSDGKLYYRFPVAILVSTVLDTD